MFEFIIVMLLLGSLLRPHRWFGWGGGLFGRHHHYGPMGGFGPGPMGGHGHGPMGGGFGGPGHGPMGGGFGGHGPGF